MTDTENSVTLSKEEHEKLLKEVEDAKNASTNVVEELKTMREAKSAEEEARKALEAKIAEYEKSPEPEDDELTPEKVKQMAAEQAEAILQKKAEEQKETSKKTVEEKFKESHKEFHPDNDAGGLKYAAFQRELSRFNLAAMESTEEIARAYEDAYRLMGKESAPADDSEPSNPSEPTTQATPPVVDPNTLTTREKQLVLETFGGDTKRYLELKAKDPRFVDNLLRQSQ